MGERGEGLATEAAEKYQITDAYRIDRNGKKMYNNQLF